MPSSAAAVMARRTDSAPRRCPATRGSPRARAQRPLPSMMIATCVGSVPPPAADRTGSVFWSDIQNVFFLGRDRFVDLLDELVGERLDLLALLTMLVLGDLVAFLVRLERLHAVTAHVAHGDAGLLGVFVRDLDQLLAALFGQRRNRHADGLTFGHRIEAEIGLADAFLDRL